jgi:ribosomal protein L37E
MSVLLDEETIVLEDLDFEIPCEKIGDHAAELSVSCRGCGHTQFICRPHFEAGRKRIEEIAATTGRRIVHRRCGNASMTVHGLAKVVPL